MTTETLILIWVMFLSVLVVSFALYTMHQIAKQ